MPREQHIKVYRSTGASPPLSFSENANGPTFGELAYVDGLTSLYIGKNNGSKAWIGAEVTGGDIEQGLEYAVPTMKAVKDYVVFKALDVGAYFIVQGEDGLTHDVRLNQDNSLTLTGGLGIDVVKSAGEDENTLIFRGVTATTTAYGVVKINPSGALLQDVNGLNISSDTTLWRLRDEKGIIDDIGYGNIVTITGGVGVDFVRTDTDTFAVRGITATTQSLGVAAFSSVDFTITDGVVSSRPAELLANTSNGLTSLSLDVGSSRSISGANGLVTSLVQLVAPDGSFGPADTLVVSALDAGVGNAGITQKGVASFNTGDFTVSSGHISLAGTLFTVRDSVGNTEGIARGNILTLTGGSGIFVHETTTDTFAIRGVTATYTALGVASFSNSHFSVVNGAVSLTSGALFAVQDSVGQTYGISAGDTLTITGGPGVLFLRDSTNDRFIVRGVTATDTTLGVASFPTTYFTVSDGVVNFASAYQATGDTVTGPNAAITVTKSGRTATIDARLATDSLTGVARFSNSHFSVTDGLVTLVSAYQVTGDTVDGPNASLKITRNGRSITLDNRFATTSLTGVASFDSRYFDTGTTGHVRIVMVDGGTFT